MKVELISYSNLGEKVCGIASKTCVSEDIPNVDDDVTKSLKSAMASGHSAVLEHWTATFSIEGVSRALTHQLVRHRTGIAYSQQSQRYVKMDDFEYVMPESIKTSKEKIYVGMELDCFECLTPNYEIVHEAYEELMCKIRETYENLIRVGIPEEDARYILPNATCTNIVVSVNARELRHIAGLRMCARAQWEIRELVTKMVELAKEVAPTIFDGVGARCEQLGYCKEQRGCGKYPSLDKVKKSQNVLD
jgi:thymidylate synthase (FAD)